MSALNLAKNIIAGAFLISAMITAWAKLALTFDGSYYLISILESRELLIPHNRVAVVLLTLPAQIMVRVTEDVDTTSLVFCSIYAIIPFASILICWLLARQRQVELMLWPLIAIGLLSIPAQATQISENLIVCQLAWPLLFSVLISKGKLATALNLAGAILLAALHPVSIIFLALIATAAWLAKRKQINTAEVILITSLFLLAGIRLAFLLAIGNAYEQETLKVATLTEMLRTGFSTMLICATGGSLALGLTQLNLAANEKALRTKLVLSWIFGTASATMMIVWSVNLQCWHQTLHYGRFLFAPFCLLMLCAVFERVSEPDLKMATNSALGKITLTRITLARAILASAIALVFLTTAVVQSYQWSMCTTKLSEVLMNSQERLIDMGQQHWLAATPLNHWSSVPLAIILQGRYPKTLLLTPEARKQITKDGTFRTAPWENKFTNKYFKLPSLMTGVPSQ